MVSTSLPLSILILDVSVHRGILQELVIEQQSAEDAICVIILTYGVFSGLRFVSLGKGLCEWS